MKEKPKDKSVVAVIMGSKSDFQNLKGAFTTLNNFKVPFTVQVISAHRTPAKAVEFATEAEKNGLKVIICAAGMAAHLSGVVASHTTLPVIGVPMACEPFNGLDSLLSTVQMPPGIPVATVTVGKAGAVNAALFAVSILALSNAELAKKLKKFRAEQSEKVLSANTAIQEEISSLKMT